MDYKFVSLSSGISEDIKIEVKGGVELVDGIVPETTRYRGLTVDPVDDLFDMQEDYRTEWYSLISHTSFSPQFVDAGVVFFTDKERERSVCISSSVQKRLEQAVYCGIQKLEGELKEMQEEKLRSSLAEFCRYLPDLDRPDASFFVDEKTGGVGATIKKAGTLSLLVHSAGAVDFSYARKAKFGGLVRITGTAKLTRTIENSEHIKTILGFLEDS